VEAFNDSLLCIANESHKNMSGKQRRAYVAIVKTGETYGVILANTLK
jgi:hypothetical protein